MVAIAIQSVCLAFSSSSRSWFSYSREIIVSSSGSLGHTAKIHKTVLLLFFN